MQECSIFHRVKLQDLPLPAEAFWKDCWVWLDQDPRPVVLQLKEQSVGVGLKVVGACLDEETLLQLSTHQCQLSKWGLFYLSFEEDLVDVSRLPILAPGVHLVHRDGEVVGKAGRRSQVVFGKCVA